MLYQGQNGILTRYDFPGGFFFLYDDENELPQLHPYAYITDHLGSVRLTVDGNGSDSGTENARQGMGNMMPSDANDPTRKNAEFSFEQNPVDTRRLLQMVSNLEILIKRTKER